MESFEAKSKPLKGKEILNVIHKKNWLLYFVDYRVA